jgi:hypothetical protein
MTDRPIRRMDKVFHELKARNKQILPFGTFRITRKGLPALVATTRHATREEAATKAKELEKLNPGKQYIVDEREDRQSK